MGRQNLPGWSSTAIWPKLLMLCRLAIGPPMPDVSAPSRLKLLRLRPPAVGWLVVRCLSKRNSCRASLTGLANETRFQAMLGPHSYSCTYVTRRCTAWRRPRLTLGLMSHASWFILSLSNRSALASLMGRHRGHRCFKSHSSLAYHPKLTRAMSAPGHGYGTLSIETSPLSRPAFRRMRDTWCHVF